MWAKIKGEQKTGESHASSKSIYFNWISCVGQHSTFNVQAAALISKCISQFISIVVAHAFRVFFNGIWSALISAEWFRAHTAEQFFLNINCTICKTYAKCVTQTGCNNINIFFIYIYLTYLSVLSSQYNRVSSVKPNKKLFNVNLNFWTQAMNQAKKESQKSHC